MRDDTESDVESGFISAGIALLLAAGVLLLCVRDSHGAAKRPRDLHGARSAGCSCLQYFGGLALGCVAALLWFRPQQAPTVIYARRSAFASPVVATAAGAGGSTVPSVAARSAPPPPLTAEGYSDLLREALAWAEVNVPLFECSNADVTAAYYYRWRLFWLHLKEDATYGFVLTEFLPHVNWAGPLDTINCPFGHQAAEARWLRTPAVLDNYSAFWFRHPQADRRYTWWPAHAAHARYLLDGRRAPLDELLPHLRAEYARWVNSSLSAPAGGPACLWQACHDDGQENSVGLDGCRPTLNAVMYGEATALAALHRAVGQPAAAARYDGEAARWRRATLSLWSDALQFFVTRTRPPPAARAADIARRRTKLGCLMCPPPRRAAPRCPPRWPDGQLVDVREIAGLTSPWYFGVAAGEHAVAFEQLTAEGGFRARWGFTTAERRHRCYNFSTDCVTSWHAPVWPFESAKLGSAMINALRGPHSAAVARHLRPAQFADFLDQYARMHTRGAAEEVPRGEPFVGESFHGDDGFWLTRRLMYERRHGDRRRGDHYFHSSYVDLVLSGLVGIQMSDSGALVVHPLFEDGQLSYMRASRVRLRGREVEILFDADGSRYGGPTGLAVYVDGALRAHSPAPSAAAAGAGHAGLEPLTVQLS